MRAPVRLSLVAVAALVVSGAARPDIVVAAFSNLTPGGRVVGWESLNPGRGSETAYTVVRDGGSVVVRAEASRSASGLVRRIRIDPAATPTLVWRWKVDGVIDGGDVSRRDGDDYPARLYVTFDYPVSRLSAGDRFKYRALRALGYRDIPTRAINYIWANRASETRPVANPYSDWVQMIPVQSGPARAGRWISESRNVAADYRAVFGEDAPAITGIAIMTDADNTRGRAVGYYGDIRMR